MNVGALHRSTSSVRDLLVIGVVIGAAYVLYQTLAKVPAIVGAGANWIAGLWVQLSTSPMQLKGTVTFADGRVVALSQLPIRVDSSGNPYTYSNGITYQLAPWVLGSDGQPTYPATAVGT